MFVSLPCLFVSRLAARIANHSCMYFICWYDDANVGLSVAGNGDGGGGGGGVGGDSSMVDLLMSKFGYGCCIRAAADSKEVNGVDANETDVFAIWSQANMESSEVEYGGQHIGICVLRTHS